MSGPSINSKGYVSHCVKVVVIQNISQFLHVHFFTSWFLEILSLLCVSNRVKARLKYLQSIGVYFFKFQFTSVLSAEISEN